MTTLRLRRRGPASKYLIWSRYRDPERWREWAPHIRGVTAIGPLRPGMEGEVTGLLGVRARFEVIEVDAERGCWTWVVRSGPLWLRIEHEVAEGRAGLVVSGPTAAVLGYVPIARIALGRLVSA